MKFNQFPESPMNLYSHIDFRAEHQASNAKHRTTQSRGWCDHSEELFILSSVSTLRIEN